MRERRISVVHGLSISHREAVVVAITRRETNSNRRADADGKPRWRVRLRRPDGSQCSETFTIRRAAERWERDQLTAQGNGGWVDPDAGRALLTDRAESFLTDRPRPLAPKTLELYGNLLDRFILPTFGDVPVGSITTEAVRAWLSRVRNDSSELQSAKAYRLLRAILNVAVSDSVIVRNPCVIRGAGQEHSAERPLATAEQIHQLADAIRPHLRSLVLLAGFGALRRRELFGLERRDVDLAAGQLSVQRQAVHLKDGARKLTAPKSAAGVRTVSLPPFVIGCVDRRHYQAADDTARALHPRRRASLPARSAGPRRRDGSEARCVPAPGHCEPPSVGWRTGVALSRWISPRSSRPAPVFGAASPASSARASRSMTCSSTSQRG